MLLHPLAIGGEVGLDRRRAVVVRPARRGEPGRGDGQRLARREARPRRAASSSAVAACTDGDERRQRVVDGAPSRPMAATASAHRSTAAAAVCASARAAASRCSASYAARTAASRAERPAVDLGLRGPERGSHGGVVRRVRRIEAVGELAAAHRAVVAGLAAGRDRRHGIGDERLPLGAGGVRQALLDRQQLGLRRGELAGGGASAAGSAAVDGVARRGETGPGGDERPPGVALRRDTTARLRRGRLPPRRRDGRPQPSAATSAASTSVGGGAARWAASTSLERGDRRDVLVDRLRRRVQELARRSHAVAAGEAVADRPRSGHRGRRGRPRRPRPPPSPDREPRAARRRGRARRAARPPDRPAVRERRPAHR